MGIFTQRCGEIVDAGEVGIKKTLGKVNNEVYNSGLHFYMPIISTIDIMDIKTKKLIGNTEAYTKDVQQAEIVYVINFNLNPEYAISMYRTVGRKWEDNLLNQVIEGSLKNIFGKWNAMDIVSNRRLASEEIKNTISSVLNEKGIIITNFELTDIKFADQFEKAVEAKVVAVQRAEEAKNKTVEIQEQARQQIIAAKAEAEAMQIKTEALSKNQALVMYEAVQKWNGQLPQIITKDGGMLLNIPEIK